MECSSLSTECSHPHERPYLYVEGMRIGHGLSPHQVVYEQAPANGKQKVGGVGCSLSGRALTTVERDRAPVYVDTGALVGLLHSTVSSCTGGTLKSSER